MCQTTSARRKQSNPGGGERKKNKKKITFLPLLPGGQLQIVGGVHLALAGLPAWQERVGGGDGEVLHARTLPELEPDVVVIRLLVGDDVHAEQPEEDHRRRLPPVLLLWPMQSLHPCLVCCCLVAVDGVFVGSGLVVGWG